MSVKLYETVNNLLVMNIFKMSTKGNKHKPSEYVTHYKVSCCTCGDTKVLTNLEKGFKCTCKRLMDGRERTFNHSRCKTFVVVKDKYKPMYAMWNKLKNKCIKPDSKFKIADEWLTFEGFKKWATEYRDGVVPYKHGLTLGRKDLTKDYTPDNCKWVTIKERQNDKSDSRILVHNGSELTAAQWTELRGYSSSLIRVRKHRGYSNNRAIEEKLYGRDKRSLKSTHNKISKIMKSICNKKVGTNAKGS